MKRDRVPVSAREALEDQAREFDAEADKIPVEDVARSILIAAARACRDRAKKLEGS